MSEREAHHTHKRERERRDETRATSHKYSQQATWYALSSLGMLLKKKGRYMEARELYDRAIKIIESKFGNEHYKYALVLNNIADIDRKVC
jgi:tetratricopeptide (TPR) repeat protein